MRNEEEFYGRVTTGRSRKAPHLLNQELTRTYSLTVFRRRESGR